MKDGYPSEVSSVRYSKPSRQLAILLVLLCLVIVGMPFWPGLSDVLRRTHMQDQNGMDRNSYHGRKYFFIDNTGKIVIDASKYERVLGFSEGLAAVRDSHGWGFIDKGGKEIIEPRFQGVGSFSEGLATVQVGGLWGFMDRQGRMIIKPQYELANPFSEGIAIVVKSQSTIASPVRGDRSQSIVVQSRVVRRKQVLVGESPGNLSGDQAAQLADKEVLLIDPSGKVILSRNLSELPLNINGCFSEGLIEADDPMTHKVGFVDKTGKFVIEPTYVQAAPFSEGRARVAVIEDREEKLGFIDHTGRFVIPPRFNTDADFTRNSTDFSEELAGLTENLRPTVTKSGKFVYIDRNGEIVLFTDFSYAGPFRDGLAVVYDSKENKSGYIDKSGTLVIPLKFDIAEDFHDGLAAVATVR